LQGSAALTLGTAFGARSALAADTTIGFIYVGSRDDYGYNQAHAQGAAALKAQEQADTDLVVRLIRLLPALGSGEHAYRTVGPNHCGNLLNASHH